MSDQSETRNVETGKKKEEHEKEDNRRTHLNDDITNQENVISSTNASIDNPESRYPHVERKDKNTDEKYKKSKENVNGKNRNDFVDSGFVKRPHKVATGQEENMNVKDEEIKENINEKNNQDRKESVYSSSPIPAVDEHEKDLRNERSKHSSSPIPAVDEHEKDPRNERSKHSSSPIPAVDEHEKDPRNNERSKLTKNQLTEAKETNCANDNDEEITDTGRRIVPYTWKHEPFEQQNSRIIGTIRNLEPITTHIRMEEIQWQRLLERKLTRKNDERELEQSYRDEIQTQIRKIEKKKKTDNLMLKRRMVEFEKRRRANNFAFCRMLQRKDKEYQTENDALQQRILEIEKQKQKNVEKLKNRVSHLEETKQREQEAFLHRMQELEHKREEEFEASQKRFQEIEKRKYNERKAWLLHVQKIEGLKKEVFKRSVQSFDVEPRETDTHEQSRDQDVSHHQNIVKNVKDQARVMETVSNRNTPRATALTLPKIPKRGLIGKVKTDGAKSRKKKEKDYDNLSVTATEKSLHSGNIQDNSEDIRQNVTVSN
ncbi:trichohyalin-like [Mytilus trossulus]|uniref:trichohyalin-like n=1 Tax=Mytilus trossulus TaxID=6551 RepID=UPI003003AB4A